MVNTKEKFCGACVAAPLALIGAGTSASSSGNKGDEEKVRKRKQIIFWTGISLTVVSTAAAIYYLTRKDCNSCKIKLKKK